MDGFLRHLGQALFTYISALFSEESQYHSSRDHDTLDQEMDAKDVRHVVGRKFQGGFLCSFSLCPNAWQELISVDERILEFNEAIFKVLTRKTSKLIIKATSEIMEDIRTLLCEEESKFPYFKPVGYGPTRNQLKDGCLGTR